MVKKIIATIFSLIIVYAIVRISIMEFLLPGVKFFYSSINFVLFLESIVYLLGFIAYAFFCFIGLCICYYLWNKDALDKKYDNTDATGVHRHDWPDREFD